MLILYGTDGCHLCHDAQALLKRMQLTWLDVDIIDDDALLDRYEIRIPVLRWGEQELDWPFQQVDVERFLAGTTR